MRLSPYPDGKMFAFTIVDDTDGSTLEGIRPVYEHLYALGLKTTKTVWVRPPSEQDAPPNARGDTLQHLEYRQYVETLQSRGFEIALHNVAGASSRRAEVISGIDEFREIFGHDPKIHIQHEKNRENVYFDVAQDERRLPPSFRSRPARAAHSLAGRLFRRSPAGARSRFECCGEDPASAYFWGDVLKARIQYVRSNIFLNDLNTIRRSPQMPFSLRATPYVNYWFDSSNGGDRVRFNALLSERQIDRLVRENGCSILYTHFGRDFVTESTGRWELNAETSERLESMAGRNGGWFAPAGDILDRLLAFQHILCAAFPGGTLLRNDNPYDVSSCTLCEVPRRPLCTPAGRRFIPDAKGMLTLPVLKAGTTVLLLGEDHITAMRQWNADRIPAWAGDLGLLWRKLRELFPSLPDTPRRLKSRHV